MSVQTSEGHVVSAAAVERARVGQPEGRVEHAVGAKSRGADVLASMEAGKRGCVTCGQTSGPITVRRTAGGGHVPYCEWCDPAPRSSGTRRRTPHPDVARRLRRIDEAERSLAQLRR